MWKEYAKHLVVRTPLEKPAQQIQNLLGFKQRMQNPELKDIYQESQIIDLIMQRLLDKSSNCIDIGCHLGSVLSLILSLSPNGHHLAFEPTPRKASWLKRKFPEVSLKEMALSDTTGEVTFHCNTTRSGYSGLHKHGNADDQFQEITVQCERLDNIVPTEQHIDFIKIDVEGGELAVLRGAVDLLSRCRPTILFECTRSGISSFGFTLAEIFEFFTEQSYSVFIPKDFLEDGKALDLEKFDKAIQYPFKALNFLAAPKGS